MFFVIREVFPGLMWGVGINPFNLPLGTAVPITVFIYPLFSVKSVSKS